LQQIQRQIRRFLSVLLCQLILCPFTFGGQQTGLKIIVLSGSGEENVINEIPPQPLAVRVVDAGNRPVTGASVVFTAPSNGAGGAFPTGPSFNTVSDEEGRALGLLYRPNSVEGSYTIQIRAEYQGDSAMATIRQSNVLVKKSKMSNKGKLVIAVVAGAGAAIAAGLAGGGSSSSNSGTPARPGTPTITFGGSTIGGQ
jgi:hypothetical protein